MLVFLVLLLLFVLFIFRLAIFQLRNLFLCKLVLFPHLFHQFFLSVLDLFGHLFFFECLWMLPILIIHDVFDNLIWCLIVFQAGSPALFLLLFLNFRVNILTDGLLEETDVARGKHGVARIGHALHVLNSAIVAVKSHLDEAAPAARYDALDFITVSVAEALNLLTNLLVLLEYSAESVVLLLLSLLDHVLEQLIFCHERRRHLCKRLGFAAFDLAPHIFICLLFKIYETLQLALPLVQLLALARQEQQVLDTAPWDLSQLPLVLL